MRPVIQPGPLEVLVVNDKAKRLDKVELYARARAKARHVAGVRRYLRMVENDMEHGSRIKKRLHRSEDARKDGGKPRRPLFTSAEAGRPAGDQ